MRMSTTAISKRIIKHLQYLQDRKKKKKSTLMRNMVRCAALKLLRVSTNTSYNNPWLSVSLGSSFHW